MYQCIVVGTDGSDTADTAVRHAFGLARMTGATVHVVTAWTRVPALVLSAGGLTPGAVVSDDGSWVHRVLDGVLEQAQEYGVRAQTHAVEDTPAKAILDTARSCHAELVVVGNQGMSGLRGKLGSVPNTVAHKSTCAVLVVPT